MNCIIYSNEIKPFVRFAGHRSSETPLSSRFKRALDCRMLYVGDGSCIVETLSESGACESIELSVGELLIIPAGVPYRMPNRCAVGEFSYFLINFDYLDRDCGIERAIPVIDADSDDEPHQTVIFRDIPELSLHMKLSLPHVKPMLAELTEIYSKKAYYFRCELNAGFAKLLVKIFTALQSKEDDRGIDAIIEYISEHYAEPITNRELGSRFFFHPNYLNRLFVSHTGKPLHRWLSDYRIDKALLLMSETNLCITEIAAATGRQSTSAFCTAFKNAVGVSPGQWKKQLR